MLKIAACILLILLGGGGGVFLSNRYGARVRQLEKCDLFLSRLGAYLGMEKLTTPELFSRLAESESLAELTFLDHTATELKEDVNFPRVWQKCLAECQPELALSGEDLRPLYGLGELIGAYDAQSQQEGIETTRTLIQEQLTAAQEQYRQNGRLSRSLGLLSGVAAAILIL